MMNRGKYGLRKFRQQRRRPRGGSRRNVRTRSGASKYGTANHGSKDITGRLTTVVIIICLSISAGYLTAAYIIGPLLDLDTSPLAIGALHDKQQDEEKSSDEDEKKTIEDKVDVEPDETEGLAESGYVLQYGSFSSKEAAQGCIDDLKKSGIEAEILEKDGAYKVVSPLFDNEQDARSKMETQKNVVDVFITHIP